MSKIKNQMKQISGPLCLCTGAGITRHFIGNWDELLNCLARQMVLGCYKQNDVQRMDLQKKLEKVSILEKEAVLQQCEYLLGASVKTTTLSREEDYLRREITMAEQVRAMLQAKENGLRPKDNSFQDYVFRVMEETERKNKSMPVSEWIAEKDIGSLTGVVRLCLKQGIAHVIDYNFDTILDESLADPRIQSLLGIKNCKVHAWTYGVRSDLIRPILHNGVIYHYGEMPYDFLPCKENTSDRIINIYHLHGVCHRDLPTQPIIFSEHAYDEYQGKQWNWSNQILVNLLERYDILTIGFSGTDLNFRRQVIRVKEEHESLMFGTEPKRVILTLSKKDYYEKLKRKGFSEDQKKFIANQYFLMMKQYYLEYYGIYVGLVNGYDDLSIRLEKWAVNPEKLGKWIDKQCE